VFQRLIANGYQSFVGIKAVEIHVRQVGYIGVDLDPIRQHRFGSRLLTAGRLVRRAPRPLSQRKTL